MGRIDRIYFYDYTRNIAKYVALKDFASEKITCTMLALSTPKVRVNSDPYSFELSAQGSARIREYAIPLIANLCEVDKELAINSPKYFLICYFDGTERYFAHNEQLSSVFTLAMQYERKESKAEYESPYMILKNDSAIADSQAARRGGEKKRKKHNAQVGYSLKSKTTQRSTKGKRELPLGKLLLALAAVALVLVVLISALADERDTVKTPESHSTRPKAAQQTQSATVLTPVAEPETGMILSGMETGESSITVNADAGSSCVVKVRVESGGEIVSFYVRAGETVTIGVPAGRLCVSFASGDIWYGEQYLFGESTHYQRDEDVVDFSVGSYEYTLYPVSNGNLTLQTISADEF